MIWPTKKLSEFQPRSIGIVGLICTSLGAIISVLSFTAGDGRQTSPISGIDYHVALISNIGFKIGFYFMILGFVFQIIERIYEGKQENIKLNLLVTTFLLSVAIYLVGINFIARFLFI